MPESDIDDHDEKFGSPDAVSATSLVKSAVSTADIADHVDEFSDDQDLMPQELLNYNIPWREGEESQNKLLEDFVSPTSRAKFSHDDQVSLLYFDLLPVV